MKIAITGHTQGIGLALATVFQQYDHEVVGFSRSNGFDINDPQSRATILSQDVDIFINNAYHPTGQTALLKELIDRWGNTDTLIINMSSKCIMFPTDDLDPLVQEYQEIYKAAKLEQEAIINDLLPHRNPKLLNVVPGVVDAGPSKIYSNDPNKIDPMHLAQLVYELVAMRGRLDVQQIVVAPSQPK
jgi:NAD(P)-dependent dehydrogenase (short-subunit alcohol dehydrogenase family)